MHQPLHEPCTKQCTNRARSCTLHPTDLHHIPTLPPKGGNPERVSPAFGGAESASTFPSNRTVPGVPPSAAFCLYALRACAGEH